MKEIENLNIQMIIVPRWHAFSGGHTPGMWDLSSPAREQTCVSTLGAWSLNHWTTREVPRVPKWDKNETKSRRDVWTKIVEIKLSELQKKWTMSAQSTSQTQGKAHNQIKYSSSQDCQNQGETCKCFQGEWVDYLPLCVRLETSNRDTGYKKQWSKCSEHPKEITLILELRAYQMKFNCGGIKIFQIQVSIQEIPS